MNNSLCIEFYKYNFLTMSLQNENIETINLIHYIFLIIYYIILIFPSIFISLYRIINNKFLPPLAYKISLKNMSILAPNSGCVSMSYFFLTFAFLFPVTIPCLLLLHFLKVVIVWIYLTIKYRQIATKELEEFEARAKRKRKDV